MGQRETNRTVPDGCLAADAVEAYHALDLSASHLTGEPVRQLGGAGYGSSLDLGGGSCRAVAAAATAATLAASAAAAAGAS